MSSKGEDDWLEGMDPQVAVVELRMQQDELRRAWAALRSTQESFSTVFDAAPIGILLLDATGKICHANLFAKLNLRLLEEGQLASHLLSSHRQALCGALNRAQEDDSRAQQLQVALSLPGEDRHRLFELQIRSVRNTPSGTPLGVSLIACLQDVTARVEAELAVRQQLAELHGLLDVSPDGVCIVSRGIIQFASRSFCRHIDKRSDDLSDTRLIEHVPTTYQNRLSELIDKADGSTSVEVHFEDSDVWLEAVAGPVRYLGNQCTLVSFRDVSERRQLESRAAQAEKVAAVGMLVAGVAHEINNPLAHILLELDAALEGDESIERARLETVRESAARIRDIVSDLRDYHRQDLETEESIDLNRVIVRAQRLTEPTLRHRAKIQSALGIVPAINGQARRLHQVLVNLLVNAADAMPTDRALGENQIFVRSYFQTGHVFVEVTDNGGGIAEEDLGQIFDPFFTRKSNRGGTGLGLTISRDFVLQMGGEISVTSELGRETTFQLKLPVPEQKRATPRHRRTPVSGHLPAARQLRLLIVDDERGILQALTRLLKGFGEIVACESVESALEELETYSDFDAILSDLVLEDGSGVALAQWMEAHRQDYLKRLVFMTGLVHNPEEVPRHVPVIRKPFDVQTLHHVVRQIAADNSLGTKSRALE